MADAPVDEMDPASMARERRKIGLGMLSTRYQRFEVAVTGKQRGPDPLSKDPDLYTVMVPQPPPPREEKKEKEGEVEEGEKKKRTPREKQRRNYARFFPASNQGRGTSRDALRRITERDARDTFNAAHAARAPARLAVRFSRDVLDLCREHDIDPHALMRESANPLSSHVDVMHGPYTPSWEFAEGEIGKTTSILADGGGGRPPKKKSPASAPASARRARDKRRARRARVAEPASAPAPEPAEPEVDPEMEAAVRAVDAEIAAMAAKREASMRRRAAVEVIEQQRHQKGVSRELDLEQWRENRRLKQLERQQQAAEASRRHVLEAQKQRDARTKQIEAEARREVASLSHRWAVRERELAEQNDERLRQQARGSPPLAPSPPAPLAPRTSPTPADRRSVCASAA